MGGNLWGLKSMGPGGIRISFIVPFGCLLCLFGQHFTGVFDWGVGGGCRWGGVGGEWGGFALRSEFGTRSVKPVWGPIV